MQDREYPPGVTGNDMLAEDVVRIGKRLHRTGNSQEARAALLWLADRVRADRPLPAAMIAAAARVPGPSNQMRKAIGATVHAIRSAS